MMETEKFKKQSMAETRDNLARDILMFALSSGNIDPTKRAPEAMAVYMYNLADEMIVEGLRRSMSDPKDISDGFPKRISSSLSAGLAVHEEQDEMPIDVKDYLGGGVT